MRTTEEGACRYWRERTTALGHDGDRMGWDGMGWARSFCGAWPSLSKLSGVSFAPFWPLTERTFSIPATPHLLTPPLLSPPDTITATTAIPLFLCVAPAPLDNTRSRTSRTPSTARRVPVLATAAGAARAAPTAGPPAAPPRATAGEISMVSAVVVRCPFVGGWSALGRGGLSGFDDGDHSRRKTERCLMGGFRVFWLGLVGREGGGGCCECCGGSRRCRLATAIVRERAKEATFATEYTTPPEPVFKAQLPPHSKMSFSSERGGVG